MFEIDLVSLILHVGYIGILLVILIENGILAGFFLPGDTLLLAVGALASAGSLDLGLVITYALIGAIIGNIIGYIIGKKYGRAVFSKETNRFFKKSYVERIEKFFQRFGKISVFLARFVPIVRTGIPTLAGIGKMNYRNFILLTIIGAVVWVVGVVMVGYVAGNLLPNINGLISIIFIGVSALTTIGIFKNDLAKLYSKIKKLVLG